MARPLEQFYKDVLIELTIAPPTGSAAAEDIQRVKDKYDAVHALLLDMNLVEWAADEAIPLKFVAPLTKVVAFYAAPAFSVPPQEYARLKMEGELDASPISQGERQLRKRMAPDYVSSPIQNEFY